MTSETVVAVVGLGYVGLPLAIHFGARYPTIGFDLSAVKVGAYREGFDPTGEVDRESFKAARLLTVTTDAAALRDADFVVVAVPTPVDEAHRPDFAPLLGASELVARNLKPGAIVVFESTVYPGATEEICVPVIEKHFPGLSGSEDFNVGYSPERINPGDTEHTLDQDRQGRLRRHAGDARAGCADLRRIIDAGVHRASSIKVAEAAKVIENTQRDLNIALMNELSLIFHRIGIDTARGAGDSWHQVELPAVSTRPGRRPLHRRRSRTT